MNARAFLAVLVLSSLAVLGDTQPIGLDPIAAGSLPAHVFPPDRVCIVDRAAADRCAHELMRIPPALLAAPFGSFYGVFDLDRDGSPELVFDTWRAEAENVVFHVFKVVNGTYREFMNVEAGTQGYFPAQPRTDVSVQDRRTEPDLRIGERAARIKAVDASPPTDHTTA